jgi:hypothetical protein
MPDYKPEALENFKRGMDVGRLFVASDGDRIIGLINERRNGHISMLFVDGLIFTPMEYILKERI